MTNQIASDICLFTAFYAALWWLTYLCIVLITYHYDNKK